MSYDEYQWEAEILSAPIEDSEELRCLKWGVPKETRNLLMLHLRNHAPRHLYSALVDLLFIPRN